MKQKIEKQYKKSRKYKIDSLKNSPIDKPVRLTSKDEIFFFFFSNPNY